MTPAEKLALRNSLAPYYTERCTIQRASAASTDPYGETTYGPAADHLVDQPCQFWTDLGVGGAVVRSGETITDLRNVIGVSYRMRLPAGTDVTEKDVVTAVTNNAGESLITNPLNIQSINNDGLGLLLTLTETR